MTSLKFPGPLPGCGPVSNMTTLVWFRNDLQIPVELGGGKIMERFKGSGTGPRVCPGAPEAAVRRPRFVATFCSVGRGTFDSG